MRDRTAEELQAVRDDLTAAADKLAGTEDKKVINRTISIFSLNIIAPLEQQENKVDDGGARWPGEERGRE